MGRIRTIKPEFPQSESIGKLSRDARLLFIQLWTIADDSGRTRASSRMLASLLYPYDDDAPNLMKAWLAELARETMIDLYSAEGNSYLQICNWQKHQKIDRPSVSRLPEFDESSRVIDESSRGLDDGPRTVDLGPRTMDHGPSRAKTARVINPQVKTLYELYPKKIGKEAAIKAIEKALKMKTFEQLLLALQCYVRKISREGTDPQFIPHPATWFNQGRYDDEEFQPDYEVKNGSHANGSRPRQAGAGNQRIVSDEQAHQAWLSMSEQYRKANPWRDQA